jgi:hypothetical protein
MCGVFCLCDAMGRRCFGLPQKVRARTYITYGLLWVALSLGGYDRLQAHAHIAPSSTSTFHAMPEVESVLSSARGRLASYRRSDGCSDSALPASLRRSLHRPHTIITHLGGGVMTSSREGLFESPDKARLNQPSRRTNILRLALVHTFRRHERGRADACAIRAGRKPVAQSGDSHMSARPQFGLNFIVFISHLRVPFLALPDGRVPAAAHTKLPQGWSYSPAGPSDRVTPWLADAGLLSNGDLTTRLARPPSAVPLFSSKLNKLYAAVAFLNPEVSWLVVVLSPLLHSPPEPALLTQFAGAGVSLATSGPIPRSADCANVLSNVYKFFLQLPPGLTFRDCASLRHLRVPVKLGWPRPGPPSGRGGG